MAFQFSVYLVPLAAAAVLSAVLAVVVFRGRNKRTAPQIFAVLVATFLWAAADALRLAVLDSTAALVLHNVRFLGSTLVVIAIFLHAMEYTGRGNLLTRRSVAGLSTVLVVTNILVWAEVPLGHGLIYAGFEATRLGSVTVFEVAFGPWFYLNAAYSYLLLLVAMAMYATEFLRRRGTFRRQTGGLLVGMAVPWVMNIVYLAGFSPIDLTAFGFTVTAVALVAQLYWFHLLDVVPIARSTVVEHIESSYLVLDHENRVLDANEAAATLFDTPQDAMIGTSVADLLADCSDIYEEFEDVRETREDITILQEEERRDYDVGISPIYDGHDQYLGRVVLIRDVTDQRRSQRQLEARTTALERRNEKLDQFASLVSHDLRNPIAVAKGHLEIAREEGAPESFDHVEESLDRMETITEDVLDLARQEREHVNVERVDLEALCKGAWGTVETHDATLVVEPTSDVFADENRLRQALENLFRNAVEHGSTSPRSQAREDAVEHGATSPPSQAREDAVEHGSTSLPSRTQEDAVDDGVTVRVGDLSDGFYVEDDGPGIPDRVRDQVFESGFTTDEEGTGLGLSIVIAAAEAHGWAVDIAESETGGARFEFTGVERPSSEGTPSADDTGEFVFGT